MKITFISPEFHNIWEPLGIGYIKSYCTKNLKQEHEWNFFHNNFYSDDIIIQEAVKSDIVAFSCTTPTFNTGISLAKRIKDINPKVYIVFGGWHITTNWMNVDYKVIDLQIIGEGESSFAWVIEGYSPERSISMIYPEFDILPWPDRDFIQQEKFLNLCEKQCGERILSFQSRRGCPMNCAMCGERCMSGKGVRFRDNDDLLDEIEYNFNKYNATLFQFVDPTWTYPKSVAKEFCKKKILRNSFKWKGMAHSAYVDEELINLMAKANCKMMNVGCESGSQRILNTISKGATISKIKKVFKLGKDAGIEMRAFFMIGMPDETMKDIEMTKQLIRDIEPDVLGVTILCPYPGTEFYRDEFKDEDWSKMDEYHSFWYTKNFTNKELVKIQKDINKEFNHILIGHQKENV